MALPDKPKQNSENRSQEMGNLIRILANNFRVSVKFVDDPEMTACYSPDTNEITMSTQFFAENELTVDQQNFVAAHEVGHLVDYLKDSKGYIELFEWCSIKSKELANWVVQQVASSGHSNAQALLPLIQQSTLNSLLRFTNLVNDIFVNNWAASNLPSIRAKGTLEHMYNQVLFPPGNIQTAIQESTILPHEEFSTALLRDAIVGDTRDPNTNELIWSEPIQKALLTPVSRGDTQITLQDFVSQINRIQQGGFLTSTRRWNSEKVIVYKAYEKLYKEWVENNINEVIKNLEEAQKKQNESGQDSESQSGQDESGQDSESQSGQDDQDPSGQSDQSGQKTNNKSDKNSPQSPSASSSDPMFGKKSNSDVGTNPILGNVTPENIQEKIDDLKKVAEEIEKGRADQTEDGKKEKEKYQQFREISEKYDIPLEDVIDYYRVLSDNAAATKIISMLWDTLLGQGTGEDQVDEFTASRGKLSVNAVINRFADIQAGKPNLPIFTRKEVNQAEHERPITVNIRFVLDCSGSMSGEGEKSLRSTFALISNSLEMYEQRYSMKYPKPKFKIDFNLSCTRYGSDVEKTKPLEKASNKGSNIRAFSTINANLGGTDDVLALKSITQDIAISQSNNKFKQKPLEIVFYITDGEAQDPQGMKQELDSSDSSVLWRGIQVANASTTFDEVWQGNINRRGIQVDAMSELPKAVAELLQDILGH